MPEATLLQVLLAVAGLGVGFFVGRTTSRASRRIRELEAQRETAGKEREHALAETAAAREALEQYRARVTDHFSGASELLRDLTQRYRAVYEHLAKGAENLCPEGFSGLDAGLAEEALPSGESVEASADAEQAPGEPGEEERS